jgi:hypothetical protein
MLMESIAKAIMASRGNQTERKDKDLIQDTGGKSKGIRDREPFQKPPRDEDRKPFRTKDRPNEERDMDTDKDTDKKNDNDTRISAIVTRLTHGHLATKVANISVARSLLSRMPPTFRQAIGA